MAPLILKAPAKINWSLYVLRKREDGYHDILSLMQTVSLCDTLELTPSQEVEVISGLDIPQEQNLVYRAALLLRDLSGVKSGARILLRKEIPTGAGLGGGSSDAAAALIGLNSLWGLGLTTEELGGIGERIGSDVPFFFHPPVAIAEGRGEILTPLGAGGSARTLLLVKPEVSVPTAWAYGALRLKDGNLTKSGDPRNNIRLIYQALVKGDIPSLSSLVHNDFEPVVTERYPVIGEIKKRLVDSGASLALMSGSGSAIFGLFEDRERASRASRDLFPHWNRIVETGT